MGGSHVLQWRTEDARELELIFTDADAVELFLEARHKLEEKAAEYYFRMNSSLRHVHDLLDNLVEYS